MAFKAGVIGLLLQMSGILIHVIALYTKCGKFTSLVIITAANVILFHRPLVLHLAGSSKISWSRSASPANRADLPHREHALLQAPALLAPQVPGCSSPGELNGFYSICIDELRIKWLL